MIQLNVLPLDSRPAGYLNTWQTDVDSQPSYEERVARGKARFKTRNTAENATFRHVKEKLTLMCQGARRWAHPRQTWNAGGTN